MNLELTKEILESLLKDIKFSSKDEEKCKNFRKTLEKIIPSQKDYNLILRS